MNFEFTGPGRIVFGPGRRRDLGSLARPFGSRALLVCGSTPARVQDLAAWLQGAGMEVELISMATEPTLDLLQPGLERARAMGRPVIIACGGGSVLDAGKALAALAPQPGPAQDHLEVVGLGKPLDKDPLPFLALPTTSGTGSEATRNAVLGCPDQGVKVSLRDPRMLARVALVDPELTLGLPPHLTATTGLDALTQLIEPFLSWAATPFTDGLAREGLPRAARALPRAFKDGSDLEARQDLALASLQSGLALANARLGAVHGLAAPFGGRFPAPHGAVCACLLPPTLAITLRALRQRAPEHPALDRLDEVGSLLLGDPKARAEDGIAWLEALLIEFALPGLGTYGVNAASLADLSRQATQSSSMKGHPLELTEGERLEILERSL